MRQIIDLNTNQWSMRWFYDSFDSTCIDARQNVINTQLHLSADQWKSAAERGYLN